MILTDDLLVRLYGTNWTVSWADPLNSAMEKYRINTIPRTIDFLAQIGHESVRLTHVEENLNYSATGLRKYFSRRFQEYEFDRYARKPQAIANRVYAGRYGNGDERSGDGWKYRGRGLIQLTFKDNYVAFSQEIGIDLASYPDYVALPHFAALSAAWFWAIHGCNELADMGDFLKETKVINGGTNGWDDRLMLRERIKGMIGEL